MSKVSADSRVAIVIHGGAGTIAQTDMTDDKEAEIRATLQQSIQAGYKALLSWRQQYRGCHCRHQGDGRLTLVQCR